MNHADEMTLMLCLDGQLDTQRAQELAGHLSGCAECRSLLRALQSESLRLREILIEPDEPVPAHLTQPPARARAPWGWIAAFGFGSAGAYTFWNVMIEPWRQQLEQAGFGSRSILDMLVFQSAFWKGWGTMRTLMEFAALGTLAVLAMVVLRHNWRRWTTVAVVMGAVLLALASPQPAAAGEVHMGESYTLPAGETVHNDLIVGSRTVRIDGNVDGDLIAWGETLRVNGNVKGDVIVASQDAHISGSVGGNLRAFTRSLIVDGRVARNATTWCQSIEFGSQGRLGANWYAFAETLTFDGDIQGDISAFAQIVNLNGAVRNVNARAEKMEVGPEARISGRVKYTGRYAPDIAAGAKLAAPIDFTHASHPSRYSRPQYYWWQCIAWAASFLFGIAFLLLLPSLYRSAVRQTQRYGPAFGFGFLFLIATPVAAVIVSFTLVGLALGISTALLYLIALYSSQVFVGGWLGNKLMGETAATGARILRLGLGLLIIRILVDVPYAGGVIKFIVALWGLGALVLACYRELRPQSGVLAPPAIAPTMS